MLKYSQTLHLTGRLLQHHIPPYHQCRRFAFSRFPEPKAPGSFRSTRRRPESNPQAREAAHETHTPEDDSQLWHTSQRPPASNPEEGLRRLLAENETLVIERQIEMLNVFVGFEQSNKYSISNEHGVPLGYIAEEPGGFLKTFSRQLLSTHRPFRALVMDLEGSPILWVRRPFAWINSRMYAQRLKKFHEYTPDGEPILDTFAEVQQRWHPWRRRYDLFLRQSHHRILSTTSEPQPEPSPAVFNQTFQVDEGFLAWNFKLLDGCAEQVAHIQRAFRGFGRELFTDTGQYIVRFGPSPEASEEIDGTPLKPTILRDLTVDERAVRPTLSSSAFIRA
ncbi:hypothetical protein CCMSSC00406_0009101 [Pleurotus cornucopiae]|uniref:Uncharacterized protein n=1 Tax=Pleurotus cornucopiae TaxID=5321 RepID=A0ACB7J613_PLECO|nr:hypothetical protein CCMSSC00406_0009101 [Pleurotus cornucopiae]